MTGPPLPASREAITASWMHRALVAGGLADCPRVEAVILEDMPVADKGTVGDTFRVRITYRDAGGRAGPETVVVKMPSPEPRIRRLGRLMSLYAVECEFYLRIAAHAPIATPTLLYGDFDARSHGFVLVLGDLGGMASVDFMEGISPERAMCAIRTVATLHAAFWDRDRRSLLARIPRFAGLWRRVTLQLYYLAKLGRALDRFGDVLRGDIRRLAEAYGPRLADHIEGVAAAMPCTLVHGDFRPTNLFFGEPGSDELAVIDWQAMALHCGLYDVAFFLINSVTPTVRREIEQPALKEYHRIVCTDGAADVSFEQCWRAYRSNCLAVLIPFVIGGGVVDLSDRRLAAGMDLLLRRTVSAIEDLGANELLPAPRSLLSPARLFSLLSGWGYRASRAFGGSKQS